jgi:integrase/recombinase XerD
MSADMGGGEEHMITDYFEAPATLERMRTSCVGPYLDDLARSMARAGYGTLTIRDHLCSVVHLGCWAQRHRIALAHWDDGILPRFHRYLARRKLDKRKRVVAHAAQFLAFLRARGTIAPAKPALAPTRSQILDLFAEWMRRHRGVTERALSRYDRVLSRFVAELGEKPTAYKVADIRAFVITELGRRSREETRSGVRQSGVGAHRESQKSEPAGRVPVIVRQIQIRIVGQR